MLARLSKFFTLTGEYNLANTTRAYHDWHWHSLLENPYPIICFSKCCCCFYFKSLQVKPMELANKVPIMMTNNQAHQWECHVPKEKSHATSLGARIKQRQSMMTRAMWAKLPFTFLPRRLVLYTGESGWLMDLDRHPLSCALARVVITLFSKPTLLRLKCGSNTEIEQKNAHLCRCKALYMTWKSFNNGTNLNSFLKLACSIPIPLKSSSLYAFCNNSNINCIHYL